MGFLQRLILPLLFVSCPLFSEMNPGDLYHVYDDSTPESVRNFYLVNHANQTLEFVLGKKEEYLPPKHLKMSIWDALKLIDTMSDDSHPDLRWANVADYFKTAEALRRDGHPRWLILVGFIYDLGKVLSYFGEPAWAVMGDTYPVGCRFSNKNAFPAYFHFNPDMHTPKYQTNQGIYSVHCGFNRVHMTWGQNEYLYHVVKNYLPPQASYILRYRSFYAFHREGAYLHLMNDEDWEMLQWLQLFSQYEAVPKSAEIVDIDRLKPYYESLVAEFFPPVIDW